MDKFTPPPPRFQHEHENRSAFLDVFVASHSARACLCIDTPTLSRVECRLRAKITEGTLRFERLRDAFLFLFFSFSFLSDSLRHFDRNRNIFKKACHALLSEKQEQSKMETSFIFIYLFLSKQLDERYITWIKCCQDATIVYYLHLSVCLPCIHLYFIIHFHTSLCLVLIEIQGDHSCDYSRYS